ncbi:MAG: TetR/AcrR family transcriptional regulator [Deinococcaceae bacterium]
MEYTSLRERQKERRRTKIYQVAIRLFKERGFHQTTATDIAEQAHVSRGTFFNYYPYKESVLLDYGVLIMEALQDDLIKELESGKDPMEILRAMWKRLAEETQKERDLFPPLAYEFLNPDPQRAQTAYNSVPLARLVRLVLRNLQAQGKIRDDISIERISNIFADNYLMTALRWAAYKIDQPLEVEMEKTLAFLLEGTLKTSVALTPTP